MISQKIGISSDIDQTFSDKKPIYLGFLAL
jgi:hypothetical protein